MSKWLGGFFWPPPHQKTHKAYMGENATLPRALKEVFCVVQNKSAFGNVACINQRQYAELRTQKKLSATEVSRWPLLHFLAVKGPGAPLCRTATGVEGNGQVGSPRLTVLDSEEVAQGRSIHRHQPMAMIIRPNGKTHTPPPQPTPPPAPPTPPTPYSLSVFYEEFLPPGTPGQR